MASRRHAANSMAGTVRLFTTASATNKSLMAAAGHLLPLNYLHSGCGGALVRSASTSAATVDVAAEGHNTTAPSTAGHGGGKDDEKGITSYWGVGPTKVTKQDGTEWKWTCFRVRAYVLVVLILFCCKKKRKNIYIQTIFVCLFV